MNHISLGIYYFKKYPRMLCYNIFKNKTESTFNDIKNKIKYDPKKLVPIWKKKTFRKESSN